MNLLNNKPRFGFDAATDRMYDYVIQKEVPLTNTYKTVDGTWDLYKVRDLIIAGQSIEEAHLSVISIADQQKAAAAKAVQPAKKPVVAPTQSGPGPRSLTAAELQALDFSATQLGALGISGSQLKTLGLTAEQITALHMTPGRATAFGLTKAQATALQS